MTSKESLEFIIKTFNELAQKPQDIGLFFKFCEAHGKVKQDLNRLEQLEKIFGDSHICEIKARFNEIECDASKCDNCPLGIGDDICLKNTFERKWGFQEERDKLKQALEILKERGGINLFINRNNNNKLTLEFDDCISCVLEPKEYALLKEVLFND